VVIAWVLISINPVMAATVSIDLAVNLSEEEKQTVKENLSLYQYRDSPFLDESYLDTLKMKGINELRTMFQTFGFYKTQISVSSTQQNSNFVVKYTVDLGPPVKIDNVDIQISGDGESDSEILNWKHSFPLNTGDTLSHSKYEEAKKSLFQLLRNRGYFSANLQAHKIEVNLDALTAQISFNVNTGPRYYFGETYYIQENYDLGYLNRFLPYKKGDLFDADLVAELHKRLSKSQEFLST
jgi:translocation and assembly module TamA